MASHKPKLNPDRLRAVRCLDDVLEYLSDELDWPIEAADLEEATFSYSPEELGVPPERAPNLVSLNQLRPLTSNQPWGVFFIQFNGPRLPITPLRRLLQALVAKKRASRERGHRSWMLDDLLFVITTDTGEAVEMHFLAFFEASGTTPEIRSLPWRPVQSPHRYLRRLAGELLPQLRWPDDPGDTTSWREQWREAFKLRHGEAIRSASRLAERMAETAIDLRERIGAGLSKEHGSGPLSKLLADVKRELVADVNGPKFADMCAQTLVYGVLSSRVTDPVGFGASPSLSVVPLSNPFLAAFFEQVHDQAMDLDLEESGLEQLIADLRETNVEAVLDQFGSTAKGGDPVIHFYEEFLKRYDRKMRADAGAFYTPQPVVGFMVRAVDWVLRARFGLEMGLADSASWRSVSAKLGSRVPVGVDPKDPFLSMIDPAAGTGTFLVEWLRQAKRSFREKRPRGDWTEHLRSFVIPSMHAFELMLGPYAIAHLKVALELHDEGAVGDDISVFLTDTLDYSSHDLKFDTMRDPVALEGEIAGELKRSERFTVVIGNPPYDREQQALGGSSKRKGGVVRFGASSIAPLLEDVTQPMREAGLGKHVKNLYNDYVYFWRWAVWQSTELPPGPGVVAFISASSYLDGVSMGGLRAFLRGCFDELWIVDLGGEGRGARPEENVFEIRTPVAICVGARWSGPKRPEQCKVHYVRVYGTRDDKFLWLKSHDLPNVEEVVPATGLMPFTPRRAAAYKTWPEITDVFPLVFPGVMAGRTWVIAPTKTALSLRIEQLLEAIPRRRRELFKDSPTGRSCSEHLARTIMPGNWDFTPVSSMSNHPAIAQFGYRSFDRQFIIADPRFLDRPGSPWAYLGPHQTYLTTLTSTKLGSGPALTASPYVLDRDYFRGSYGAKNVMPVYRDPRGREPNVARGLLEKLSARMDRDVAAEDLVAYVYGMLGTGAFAARFDEELSEMAGPVRVPLTALGDLFAEVCDLGRDLLWWHTWGERFHPRPNAALPTGQATELAPVVGYPERFGYDAADQLLSVGSGVFGPVSNGAWRFEVSGLKVLQSWLGYRMAVKKGRRSSPLDDIVPHRWTLTGELRQTIAILEHTVEVTPKASRLLDAVLDGPLVLAAELPGPDDWERKASRS